MGNALGWFSAGSGLLGDFFTGWNNMRMLQQAQNFQRAERIAAQEYQTGEREAMQQYQTSEREAQNQYSEDMYNKYSSPESRVRQLKAAGLNPILASDNSGVGSVAVSSGSSGGAPGSGSGLQGHAPTPPYQQVGSWTNMMLNTAEAVKTLAEAKKVGLDVKWYEDLVKSKLRSNELQQAFQELVNSVESWRMPKKAQAELDLLYKTLLKEDATIEQIKAHTDKLVQEGRISKQTADTFMEAFKNTQDNLKSQTAVNNADVGLKEAQTVTEKGKPALQKSEISKNYAEAGLASAKTTTEAEMPEYYRSGTRLNYAKADTEDVNQSYLYALTRYNKQLEKMEELKVTLHQATLEGDIELRKTTNKTLKEMSYEQLKLLREQVRIAEKEGNWKDLQILSELIANFARAYSDFIGIH